MPEIHRLEKPLTGRQSRRDRSPFLRLVLSSAEGRDSGDALRCRGAGLQISDLGFEFRPLLADLVGACGQWGVGLGRARTMGTH